jgi:Protein of unknown function (DUF4012)
MAVRTNIVVPRRHPVPRRRPRRWSVRLLLVAAAAFLLTLAAGLLLLLPARDELAAARDQMRAGREALVEGEPAKAGDRFASARAAFARAEDGVHNPFTALAGAMPIVGRTPDTVAALAEGGAQVARAGQVLSTALEDLPGGVASLAPRDGTLALGPLERLAGPVRTAAGLVAAAAHTLRSVPTSLVPGPVARPAETFVHQIGDLRRTLETAHGLLRRLPVFLGEGGPRRYFFGAQNPTELRGTGGFVGAFTILTVEDGRLSIGSFRDVGTLRNVSASEIEPPSEDYARLYNRYGGAGFWKNINMTPDFPSAATAIERLYQRTEGERLDGTIFADPAMLASLVEGTGPVEVLGAPGPDPVELEADDVVPFLANGAYTVFKDSVERKRVLGAMAGQVLERFLEGAVGEDPVDAARALFDAAADGHLLLHSADPSTQRAFERAGIAGGLAPPDGDHLAVVVNNAGANKVDFYVDRTVRYTVRLLPDRIAEADVTVRYQNDAPDRGQPEYVIGPHPSGSKAGEDVMIASTYCGRCRIHRAVRDGTPTAVTLGEELGHGVVTSTVRVPGGGTSTVSYGRTIFDAWTGSDAAGTYSLTFQGQPTIRATELEVVVVAPPGTVITGAHPSMDVEGGRATWKGEPGDRLELEVRFSRPLGVRILEAAFPYPS